MPLARLLFLVLVVVFIPVLGVAAEPVDYTRQIKPILAAHCYRCHGPLKQESNMRLDTAAGLKQGGDNGAALVPGKPEESLVVHLIEGRDGWQMPPEGEPLARAEIELIKTWIAQGAPAPADERPQPGPRDHWAYRPPEGGEVPTPRDAAWVRNPVDAFLAAEHERRGLTHSPPAHKATLLRRVYLDLIGLPPTRAELHAFLDDDRPGAYERVVDRLLASPHYGERWGRHWMDVWRYSDWYGYRQEVRNSQPHIWRWRDWIVESLNDDKGYDQMVREMLAGDEIAPGDPDIVRATGYLARSWYKSNRHLWLKQTVDHAAQAFLGMTIGCARCHDHMYDPLTQADYYHLRAFFEPHQVRLDRVPGELDTKKAGLARVYDADLKATTYLLIRGDERRPDKSKALAPRLPEIFGDIKIEPVSLPVEAYYPALREHVRRAMIARAEGAASAATAKLEQHREKGGAGEKQLAEKSLAAAKLQLASLKARIAAEKAKYLGEDAEHLDELTKAAVLAELRAKEAEAAKELAGAEHQLALAKQKLAAKSDDAKLKKAVEQARGKVKAARKKLSAASKALAEPGDQYSPLGKVYPRQSSGRRTALANWIASRDNPLTARVAVNHIWMRHFGEPLVPTVFDFGLNGKPPTHPRLLDWLAVELMEHDWSMKHIHRLLVTSSAYRMRSSSKDASAANLEGDPENRYLWRMNARRMEAEIVRDAVLAVSGHLDRTMGGPELDQNAGQTTFRRSIYYRHAAEKQMLFLRLFDAANIEECYRRNVSVVPQQALALVNSPLAVEHARRLAGKLSDECESRDKFIVIAFEQILSRRPTSEEAAACGEFLDSQAALLGDPDKLQPFAGGAKSNVPPSKDPRRRARENLVLVLLNHNDFQTIR
jgi:mono/diheme cytochrome c family protein